MKLNGFNQHWSVCEHKKLCDHSKSLLIYFFACQTKSIGYLYPINLFPASKSGWRCEEAKKWQQYFVPANSYVWWQELQDRIRLRRQQVVHPWASPHRNIQKQHFRAPQTHTLHFRHGKNCLMWSLWDRTKVITITEW